VNECNNEVSFALGSSKRVSARVLSNESRLPVNRGQKFVSTFLDFDIKKW